MGRKSLKETRQKEIIEGFYTVAKKQGLENTSIAKLATHLRVNPSLIMHYFSSRENLLNALVDFIRESYSDIYEVNDGGIDTKEKLLKLIDNLFSRKWNKLFDDGVFYSCYALTYRNKNFRSCYKKMHEVLHEMLLNSLRQAAANHIVPDENIEEKVTIIFSIVDGAYYFVGMMSDKKEIQAKEKLYKKYVLELLGLK
ncbi:MAG: TetR family transcriptional regulator [Mangrovibacterium sp.]